MLILLVLCLIYFTGHYTGQSLHAASDKHASSVRHFSARLGLSRRTRGCPKDYAAPSRAHVDQQLGQWEDDVYEFGSNVTWHPTSRRKYCQVFRHICMDQGRFVVYDEADMPWTGTLPEFELAGTVSQDFPGGPKGHMARNTEMPSPFFRPHTRMESSPDLAHPQFSNCTVPIVMFLSFQYNAAEVVEKVLVPLWAASQRGAWDKRYTIVVNHMGQAMPENLRLFASFLSNSEPVRRRVVCEANMPDNLKHYPPQPDHVGRGVCAPCTRPAQQSHPRGASRSMF